MVLSSGSGEKQNLHRKSSGSSTVLEKIGMSENENAKMLLLGEKEEITENGDWAEEKQIQISKEENSIYRMVGEKKKYLLITEPFRS